MKARSTGEEGNQENWFFDATPAHKLQPGCRLDVAMSVSRVWLGHPNLALSPNTAASIGRLGLWDILYYASNKEPPK